MILRTGMTPTGVKNSPAPPQATGLETDKLSKEHIHAHFDAFLGEIHKHIPEADRKCWKYTVLDSYEKGGQNITDNFLELFKLHYGYDPTPFLPTYYGYPVGSYEISDRFLWDMRRFVADRIALRIRSRTAGKITSIRTKNLDRELRSRRLLGRISTIWRTIR